MLRSRSSSFHNNNNNNNNNNNTASIDGASGAVYSPNFRITQLKRGFATQALLYCFAFVLTWVFRMAGASIVQFQNPPQYYYPITVLSVILASLQGFFNACIYIRPRYLRYRKLKRSSRQQTNDDAANNFGESDESPVAGPFQVSAMEALRKALSVAPLDDHDELCEIEQQQEQQQQQQHANSHRGADDEIVIGEVTVDTDSRHT